MGWLSKFKQKCKRITMKYHAKKCVCMRHHTRFNFTNVCNVASLSQKINKKRLPIAQNTQKCQQHNNLKLKVHGSHWRNHATEAPGYNTSHTEFQCNCVVCWYGNSYKKNTEGAWLLRFCAISLPRKTVLYWHIPLIPGIISPMGLGSVSMWWRHHDGAVNTLASQVTVA